MSVTLESPSTEAPRLGSIVGGHDPPQIHLPPPTLHVREYHVCWRSVHHKTFSRIETRGAGAWIIPITHL